MATNVEVTVNGPVARAVVTQRFLNPSDAWVEGVYVFPLVQDAAVDGLRMKIGNRFIEGVIEERAAARARYEAAKAEGKKASLIEQERPNVFTNSVANVGPGETVVVQITYQHTPVYKDGAFSLRVPLVVAPRYHPVKKVEQVRVKTLANGWAVADPVPDRGRLSPPVRHPDGAEFNLVSLSVRLDTGFPLGDVVASHHQITLTKDENGVATATLAEGPVPANRDFELVWRPTAGTAPNAALFSETIDGERYHLIMLTPPTRPASPAPARSVTFVIDTSGSMAGGSIRQAQESLLRALGRLRPIDSVNLIRFSSETRSLFPSSLPATKQTLDAVRRAVIALEADGGTEMLPAIEAALGAQKVAGDQIRQVIFLTDGAIGDEARLFRAIEHRRGDARIHMVGIGSAPNAFFVNRAAEIGRGSATIIGSLNQVGERMAALFKRLESPAVTDLQIVWPEGMTVEAWPSPIPDLHNGGTLVVAARSDQPTGEITLTGRQGTVSWTAALSLDQAADSEGIAKTWARRKIASLETARARGTLGWETLDEEILSVALTHGLVTRLTSLVAVDVTPSRPVQEPWATTEVPLDLPQGWSFEKVFGKEIEDRWHGHPSVRKASLGLSVAGLKAMDAPATRLHVPARTGLSLPQTATAAEIQIWVGMTLLGLALLWLAVQWLRRWASKPLAE